MWCRLTLLGPDGSLLRRCTLSGPDAPDLEAVDRVARLKLDAVRAGGSLVLADVAPAFAELLELAGLSDLLGQVGRQAEGGEDPARVEE
jgi:hypothetical protein